MRPAAHPQIELTTTMVVPFSAMAFSTSSAVRASAIPAAVSSWRIGATIISGYIGNSSWLDLQEAILPVNQTCGTTCAAGQQRKQNLEMQRKRRKQRFLGYCREISSNLSGRRKGLANVTTPKILCFLC